MAQSHTKKNIKQYNNSLTAGISIAIADIKHTNDPVSLFYNYEYIHGLNRFINIGLGMGFFNEQQYNFRLHFSDGTEYKEPNQAYVSSFNITGYLDAIKTPHSLLRFGLGYTGRFVKIIYPYKTYYSFDINYAAAVYKSIKAYESGLRVNLEYGYQITPYIRPSVSFNIYSHGKYSGFYMVGFNLSYCF